MCIQLLSISHFAPSLVHDMQWYTLSVTYNYHRLRSSVVEGYVNGQQVLSAEVSMPSTDDVRECHVIIVEM